MKMNLWSKKMVSLCGFLALLGCDVSSSQLLLNTKVIEEVSQGETLDVPAVQVLPESIKYICSVGSYFDVSYFDQFEDVDEASQIMLRELDIFPTEEGEGYFVYFDREKKLVQHDRLLLNEEKIRWSEPERDAYREVYGRCIDLSNAIIQVVGQQNYHQISLKLRKN
jgi:hypothetical protein